MTDQELKDSTQFKEWIDGRVDLIHNPYYDNKPTYDTTRIVISSDMGKNTITRFFEMGGKIQVSVDYRDISIEETYKILLKHYSRRLI